MPQCLLWLGLHGFLGNDLLPLNCDWHDGFGSSGCQFCFLAVINIERLTVVHNIYYWREYTSILYSCTNNLVDPEHAIVDTEMAVYVADIVDLVACECAGAWVDDKLFVLAKNTVACVYTLLDGTDWVQG